VGEGVLIGGIILGSVARVLVNDLILLGEELIVRHVQGILHAVFVVLAVSYSFKGVLRKRLIACSADSLSTLAAIGADVLQVVGKEGLEVEGSDD